MTPQPELPLVLWLGKLVGVTRCGADRNGVFSRLLQSTLPVLGDTAVRAARLAVESVPRALLQTLSAVLETHLHALRPAVCVGLYRTARTVVELLTTRMTGDAAGGAGGEEAARSDLLGELLLLLVHHGTKE